MCQSPGAVFYCISPQLPTPTASLLGVVAPALVPLVIAMLMASLRSPCPWLMLETCVIRVNSCCLRGTSTEAGSVTAALPLRCTLNSLVRFLVLRLIVLAPSFHISPTFSDKLKMPKCHCVVTICGAPFFRCSLFMVITDLDQSRVLTRAS